MPARKHREGKALEDWLAKKSKQSQQMETARLRVQSLTDHVLLRPIEVAAMLGTTRKTLREMEARGELPPRVTFSAKVFGWRLGDMEALIRERMGFCAPRVSGDEQAWQELKAIMKQRVEQGAISRNSLEVIVDEELRQGGPA